MKKKLLALSCCLILAMGAFVGCGNNGDEGKEPEKQPPVTEIMNSILESVTETGALTDVTEDEYAKEMFKDIFAVEGVTERVIYMNMMNIRTDEIGIIKTETAEQAGAVKEAIKKHVEDRIAGWMPGYMPEEIAKMENYTVLEKGNYVLFAIASDADQKVIAEKFEAAFK